jgi:hypothetical protein
MSLLFALLVPTAAAQAEPPSFRAGAYAGAGFFQPGPMIAFDSALQAGVQIVPNFGSYLEVGTTGGFGIGGSLSESSASLSVSAIGGRYVAPMAELDAGPWFLAAGPMLSWIDWAQVVQSANTDGEVEQYAAVIDSRASFGLQGRTGFFIGAEESRVKATFSVGARALNGKITEVSQSASQNGAQQGVLEGGRRWGVMPTVALGVVYK